MYATGWQKEIADLVFEENTAYQASLVMPGCRPYADWVAYQYYLAVKNGGAGAYNRATKGALK